MANRYIQGTQFDPDQDIPDLTGKVILVTGANSGIGRGIILQLAKHNPAQIFLAARSEAKAQEAITELEKISDMQSIDIIPSTFHASSNRLDLLINSTSIMATPTGQTEEGYEIQFGTNHIGHALLTRLLLPTLKYTATIAPDVRVVFLSSSLHSSAPKEGYFLDDRLKTPMPDISTWTLYGQSKLANIHYCRALAQRHLEIKFVSIHPGLVKTNLGPEFMSVCDEIHNSQCSGRAFNSLWAATSLAAESGAFYYPVGITGKDEKLREQLWEYTEMELQPHLDYFYVYV
ncbi:NAD(P)-binding protein [Aspergillus transmontanensis]|uniref:NAD(P)-binding protein n=1 Tax=Aspergillus transmontanensis TaxID=1034304 RepID=A0A5N6WH13_9EURO|nr:NAD(P)-binding protein [Aspergillus transmontanensis]